ncbi:MAG: MBL fold metallo-hydrolase [Ruminococcaceae bacterium]|nr:MBL fold metallo-hydrolase [Oscillospiraceae bacterium]
MIMKIFQTAVGMLGTNCYLLVSGNEAAIVDPGASGDRVITFADKICGEQVKVKYVLLTHGHFDHIGAVAEVKAYYGAALCIHEEDADRLVDPDKYDRYFARVKPIEGGADRLLKDGDTISLGDENIDVIHLPGHTPGGVAYRCGDILITGDTLFHGDIGRTDLAGGDQKLLMKSLAKLARLEGDYVIYPGHEEGSTLNEERAYNLYMREAVRRGL